MSEEKRDTFLDQYDLREAISHIKAAAIGTGSCPWCDHNDWVVEARYTGTGILSPSTPTPVFAMKDPRGFYGPAPSIPTVAFTCANCGYLRLHNWAWLKSLLEKQADSDV